MLSSGLSVCSSFLIGAYDFFESMYARIIAHILDSKIMIICIIVDCAAFANIEEYGIMVKYE